MLGLFLSAVKQAGVMGITGASRTAGHGVTPPRKGKVATCFRFTKDKWICSEKDNFVLVFTKAALVSNKELVKGVTLAYRRKQAGAGLIPIATNHLTCVVPFVFGVSETGFHSAAPVGLRPPCA